jgi:hypothetical protein
VDYGGVGGILLSQTRHAADDPGVEVVDRFPEVRGEEEVVPTAADVAVAVGVIGRYWTVLGTVY